jgi:Na+-driven multidrug efflux pump
MFSYASIITAILAFGMETTFFRYLNKHEDKKQEVYNNSFFTIAFIAVLFLITSLVFTDNFARFTLSKHTQANFHDQRIYIQYLLWILFIDAICVIPFAKLRADGKPFKYSMVKFVNIGVFVGLNLMFIYIIPSIIKNNGIMHDLWGSL